MSECIIDGCQKNLLLAEMDERVKAERERCIAIVQAARRGDIDGDLRCLISRMKDPNDRGES